MDDDHRRILKERARSLASPFPGTNREPDRFDAVCFSIGEERYAMAIDSVRAVVPLKDLAPIPCTPAFVTGLMNVRGQLVTVLDLARLFGLKRDAYGEATKVLIVHSGRNEAGIVADAVQGIFPLRGGALQLSVPTFEGIRAELTRGVSSDGLVVLDAAKLLGHPSILVCEEAPG